MIHLHQKAGGSRKPPTHETIDAREHYVYQEGQAVFKFAVTNMADVAVAIMQKKRAQARRYFVVGASSGQYAYY